MGNKVSDEDRLRDRMDKERQKMEDQDDQDDDV